MNSPYLILNISYIGLLQFGLTVFLVIQSIIHAADSTSFADVNNHPKTKWAIENYKINADGVKYFNRTNPKTGEQENGTLPWKWFDKILEGKYVYLFGNKFDNYCWPRVIPPVEWFPSIFRASQLKPSVQVPFRAAVLLGMTFRVFQAIVLAFMRLKRNPDSRFHRMLMMIFVVNELLHNSCLFLVSNFLLSPDEDYRFLFNPILFLVYVSFGLKMIFSIWHLGFHFLTITRLLLLCIFVGTFVPNYYNINEYFDHNFCDQYTYPLTSIYEVTALLCLLTSELMDVIQSRYFEAVFGLTEEESRDEDNWRLEGEKKTPVL